MGENRYNLSERLKEILKSEPTSSINTIERQTLRIKIAKNMTKQGSYNSKTQKPDNPVFFNKRIDYVIGIAGGGKSTVLANPLSEKYNAIIIDSDIAKEQLPEYENGLGATRIHKESKQIFRMALKSALENNMNIVVSFVGRTLNSIMEIYNEAEELGYEQHIHLNEVPPNIAVQRAVERFKEIGRYIEPEYILNSIGYKPTENYNTFKEMGIFLSYEKYDNNVPFGEKPILLEQIFTERDVEKDQNKEERHRYNISAKEHENIQNILDKRFEDNEIEAEDEWDLEI